MVDNTTNKIGEKNPYRYRSYYYDTETTWYYLNSRYYNPNIGRFITMDEVEYLGATSSILSYNLFTYCEGNPVNRVDSDGKWPKWLKKVVETVVAVVATATAVTVVAPVVAPVVTSVVETASTVALTTASTAIGIVSEVVEKATTTVITGVLSALPILVIKECVTLGENVNLCPYSYGGISTEIDNISSFPIKQSNPPSELFYMARTGIMLKNEFLCYMC